MTNREKIMNRVHNERDRQEALWGQQDHTPEFWLSILGEEFGEVCTAVCEHDMENYRVELVQVAAVAVSMIESFDRQTDKVIDVVLERK